MRDQSDGQAKGMYEGARGWLPLAGFRAVDLACLLAAPLVVGLVGTFCSMLVATLLLAAYTLLAWVPEVQLLSAAVRCSPELGWVHGWEAVQANVTWI